MTGFRTYSSHGCEPIADTSRCRSNIVRIILNTGRADADMIRAKMEEHVFWTRIVTHASVRLATLGNPAKSVSIQKLSLLIMFFFHLPPSVRGMQVPCRCPDVCQGYAEIGLLIIWFSMHFPGCNVKRLSVYTCIPQIAKVTLWLGLHSLTSAPKLMQHSKTHIFDQTGNRTSDPRFKGQLATNWRIISPYLNPCTGLRIHSFGFNGHQGKKRLKELSH